MQIEQVKVELRDRFPGRARDIHRTWDVRSRIPKKLWRAIHLRREGLRRSWLTHVAISGGLRREVAGQAIRWAPSRGMKPSQGQGGGGGGADVVAGGPPFVRAEAE